MSKPLLLVKDVMITKFTTIPEDFTIKEAAEILHKGGFSGAPVINSFGKLVGIISEKDLFRALFPSYGEFYEQEEFIPTLDSGEIEKLLSEQGDKKIKEIIKEPITTSPDTPLVSVGAIMIARGIHRLPVLENDKLVGMISRRLIYRTIFKHIFGFKK